MRRNIKSTDPIFPMPVFMVGTFNDDETVDVMNVAWGMMIDYGYIVLNIEEGRKTFKNIMNRRAFTVSLADADHMVEADYFGVVSGNRDVKKFENSGLSYTKSENVDAPIVNEFAICMECEFVEFQDNEFGCGVVGKIVNVSADEKVMNGDKVDTTLLNALAYDPFTKSYYKIGKRIGSAYKDGLKLKK